MPGQLQMPEINSDDLEEIENTFKLREESRKRHPELIRLSRPTAKELREQAAVLKGYFNNRFIDPVEKNPYATSDVIYFKHQVGDGLHYIDNRIIRLGDNTEKSGSTSESCILKSVHIICARHRVGRLPEMWNRVYKNDPLSDDDLTHMIAVGVSFTEPFNPMALENILDAASDLREIKCGVLADLFEQIVLPKIGTVL